MSIPEITAATNTEQLIKTGLSLPLMERFPTIQGEGFHQGKQAYFIRLAGCNVGCHWCDVKESWDPEKHPVLATNDIVAEAKKERAPMVVITGGEPLIYNLDYICNKLHEEGLQTHLETSGAYPLSGSWDWVCLSPKKFKAPLPDVIQAANELKVVIFHPSDFEWAEKYAELVSNDCILFLQPEWSKSETMIPLIVEYIRKHPKWRVSLQVHKYMNIP